MDKLDRLDLIAGKVLMCMYELFDKYEATFKLNGCLKEAFQSKLKLKKTYSKSKQRKNS